MLSEEELTLHAPSIQKAISPSGPHDRRGPAISWIIGCTCGWHVHDGYPAQKQMIFDWHIDELNRLDEAFRELVGDVQKKLSYRHPADIKLFLPFQGPMDDLDKTSESSREEFATRIAGAIERQDVEYDHCTDIVRTLRHLYIYVDEPRTKKVTPEMVIGVLFGKSGPDYGDEDTPSGELETGER